MYLKHNVRILSASNISECEACCLSTSQISPGLLIAVRRDIAVSGNFFSSIRIWCVGSKWEFAMEFIKLCLYLLTYSSFTRFGFYPADIELNTDEMNMNESKKRRSVRNEQDCRLVSNMRKAYLYLRKSSF
jgi:hypothetical protein